MLHTAEGVSSSVQEHSRLIGPAGAAVVRPCPPLCQSALKLSRVARFTVRGRHPVTAVPSTHTHLRAWSAEETAHVQSENISSSYSCHSITPSDVPENDETLKYPASLFYLGVCSQNCVDVKPPEVCPFKNNFTQLNK